MRIVPKTWGYERWIVNNDKYCGKILVFKDKQCCSLHAHNNKEETFYVLSGGFVIFLYDAQKNSAIIKVLKEEGTLDIPVGLYHSIRSVASLSDDMLSESSLLEFSTHHEDSDSYRLDVKMIPDKEILKAWQNFIEFKASNHLIGV